MDEDPRLDRAIFVVLVDPGYESKNGYSALDTLIKKFWKNIDIDFIKDKDLAPFQFSRSLKSDFNEIMVYQQ